MSQTSLSSPDPSAQGTARAQRSAVIQLRDQRPRYRRREARTAPGVEGTESPEVVEEGLEDLRDKEVRDERRVGVHTGDGLAHSDLEFREAGYCFLEVVAVLFQPRSHRIELLQRRRQLTFVVMHQSGQLLGHRRRSRQQLNDLVPPPRQDLQQIVGVENELVDLLAAFGQDAGDSAGTLEQVAQARVAVVEALRQPADRVKGRSQLWGDLVER